MITGAHLLLYSQDAERDRAFFRDVLEFRSVDAGEGWPIFALPPAELGVHPRDANSGQDREEHSLLAAEFYLMCDDLPALVKSLESKGVRCAEVSEAPWGRRTAIRLPSGGQIGLYQPTHPTAIG
jgi:catechol 2,3-dioxygenase-like lactoylglutathione lyase family enzyme